MTNVHRLIEQAIAEQSISDRSSGELCEELFKRLNDGMEIKITSKGVRVTHRDFIDKLLTAGTIDKALSYSR